MQTVDHQIERMDAAILFAHIGGVVDGAGVRIGD